MATSAEIASSEVEELNIFKTLEDPPEDQQKDLLNFRDPLETIQEFSRRAFSFQDHPSVLQYSTQKSHLIGHPYCDWIGSTI